MEDNQSTEDPVNKCGRRVLQMRREGRDIEYMINQLDYEGFDHQLIKRMIYGVNDQIRKEEKQADKEVGNYFLLRAAIGFGGVLVLAVITFFVGFSIGMIAIDIAGLVGASIYLVLGYLKRNG